MKKLLFVFAVSAFFVACNDAGTSTETTSDSSTVITTTDSTVVVNPSDSTVIATTDSSTIITE